MLRPLDSRRTLAEISRRSVCAGLAVFVRPFYAPDFQCASAHWQNPVQGIPAPTRPGSNPVLCTQPGLPRRVLARRLHPVSRPTRDPASSLHPVSSLRQPPLSSHCLQSGCSVPGASLWTRLRASRYVQSSPRARPPARPWLQFARSLDCSRPPVCWGVPSCFAAKHVGTPRPPEGRASLSLVCTAAPKGRPSWSPPGFQSIPARRAGL
jgi:hypothetical protein